jgi:hypothetical protein
MIFFLLLVNQQFYIKIYNLPKVKKINIVEFTVGTGFQAFKIYYLNAYLNEPFLSWVSFILLLLLFILLSIFFKNYIL